MNVSVFNKLIEAYASGVVLLIEIEPCVFDVVIMLKSVDVAPAAVEDAIMNGVLFQLLSEVVETWIDNIPYGEDVEIPTLPEVVTMKSVFVELPTTN